MLERVGAALFELRHEDVHVVDLGAERRLAAADADDDRTRLVVQVVRPLRHAVAHERPVHAPQA
jgi:hypothetical protein